MVISLYGAPTSWNTLRARYVLFELGLTDIKFITLSLAKGEQKVCISQGILIFEGRDI